MFSSLLFLLFAAAPAGPVTAGQILVATPKSSDPDFAKSVVVVVHSDDRGVIGLMVNRTTDVPLAKVFPVVRSQQKVWFGGPVAIGARALIRSASPGPGATRLFGDVSVISSRAAVVKLVETGLQPDVFRVYAGYTGWSAVQIQSEIGAGLWRVIPGDARVVFAGRPDLLWSVLNR